MIKKLIIGVALLVLPLSMDAFTVDMAQYDYDFCIDGVYYMINRDTEGEVTVVNDTPQYTSLEAWEMAETPLYLDYTPRTDIYAGQIFIPSTVKAGDKTYTVTRIGYAAFAGCSALEKLTLPETITEIWPGAFIKCTAMREINIPASVTTLQHGILWECSSLTSLDISGAGLVILNFLSDEPFMGCSSLSSLILPIDARNYNFEGLPEKCSLYLNNPVPPGKYFSFSNHTYATSTLYVPENSIEAYRSHEEWGKFLNIAAAEQAGAIAPGTHGEYLINGNTIYATGNSPVQIYNIGGVLINAVDAGSSAVMPRGFFIISCEGTYHKVCIG